MAANSWVKVDEDIEGDKRGYTVASGTAISQGTLMQLSADNTMSAASADNQIVAGIMAMDKSASDSSTRATVYVLGRFEAKSSSTASRGQCFGTSKNANEIRALVAATTRASGQMVGGHYTEEASAAETVNVLLNVK